MNEAEKVQSEDNDKSKWKRVKWIVIGILLAPIFLWFIFGAGIPVTMQYLGLSKNYHDVILGGSTPEDMQRWKQENIRKSENND